MLDRQSGPATLGEPQDARNKPYRPFLPWWTGSRLFQEVTVQIPEQATSQHFGSPAAYTSILSEGQVPQRTMHKLLYEPNSCWRSTGSSHVRSAPSPAQRKGEPELATVWCSPPHRSPARWGWCSDAAVGASNSDTQHSPAPQPSARAW